MALAVLALVAAGCSSSGSFSGAPTSRSTAATTTVVVSLTTTTIAPTTTTIAPTTTSVSTTGEPVTSTTVPAPRYVFPFVGHAVSFGPSHHDYPATDVFGCGATVVAPTSGLVERIRTVDLWDPAVNSGSTRGGKYVEMIGDDGVRYYFAHLASAAVHIGQRVAGGDVLGPMGQTGDARASVCHTHVGISWPCPGAEWQVRRGAIWPAPYLDAWRNGVQKSPAAEVVAAQKANPSACAAAMAKPDAANS
jgi:murein DD-endopeptidase MepM/ murein hydrolase activator NlpD